MRKGLFHVHKNYVCTHWYMCVTLYVHVCVYMYVHMCMHVHKPTQARNLIFVVDGKLILRFRKPAQSCNNVQYYV